MSWIRALMLFAMPLVAAPLAGCGHRGPVNASVLAELISPDLPTARGADDQSEAAIVDTMTGLCGARILDRAKCDAFDQRFR